ncbi:midasin [Coccidioides immitis RMSCC 3703]|uniref:Midasin n=1 Tax=Coccidioides immitis RMSCC 3703 TaxID=454286 RepID=A0A0J8R8P1_COCIT|nr:midasin [Coccidioides immitis RMSCC 3703]
MNIVTSILSKSVEDIFVSCQSLGAIRTSSNPQNIRQMCARLERNYRAYDDITVPVVRFLELLDLGIGLFQYSQVGPTDQQSFVRDISQATPFLGQARTSARLLRTIGAPHLARLNLETDLYRLSVISASQNTDSRTLHDVDYREILRSSLQHLYMQWKEQLQADQVKEAERSALFRYRGSVEDQDEIDAEELLHMFPTFDEEPKAQGESLAKFDNKGVASKLSKLFKELFTTGDRELEIKGLIAKATELIGSILPGDELSVPLVQPQNHLSAVLLLLEDEVHTSPMSSYNFYTDPNLPEVKKLADLVERTQRRFYELQRSWPEHATLADAITCCSEIYQFKHCEPVAKFLTKAEKLHGYIHEWQTVASKEFSAANFYDELTALLISWRRLELSTWARLLDIEYEKCEQDADGWWFVAYEVIVATPLQLIQEGQDLVSHTCELISTLEKFICSTPIGQYRSRLQLVERFNSLLQLYAIDFPSLRRVISALANLINHYKPFVQIFEEQLSNGRKSLETDIKQEILLTSWKDTNITALRESARRSHYKLFKVVRKYRAILGQLSDSTIENGLPTSAYKSEPAVVSSLHKPEAVSSTALSICQEVISTWGSRPARFKDIDATTGNMRHVYQRCFADFSVPCELDAFIRDVIDSINDFKSKTPKTLTEENKEEVQHLKVQKRRFYAEKLRELRHMGIRSNLGTDILEKQSSRSSILASTPALACSREFHQIESADSYFHRFVDLLSKARQAAREYSEDLSNVEAGRSAGFVEGILSRARTERTTIYPALTALDSLTTVIQEMDSLSCLSKGSLRVNAAMAVHVKDLQGTLRWLSALLETSVAILNIHARHTNTDLSRVLNELSSRKDQAEGSYLALESLATLPKGLSSDVHEDQILQAQTLITQIQTDVIRLGQTHPDVAFAMDQILPWTKIDLSEYPNPKDGRYSALLLKDIDKSLLSVIDKVFVVLQRLSNCLSSYPASTENTGWLAKTDSVLSKALEELHMEEIANRFCSPTEASDEQGSSGKLENGTGLGDGGGAEDISKDVQDDEDLSDLAQQKSETTVRKTILKRRMMQSTWTMKTSKADAEDFEQKEKGQQDEDESDLESADNMDEEVGSVDGWDQDAVDEKLWDGKNNPDQKDTENEEGKGSSNTDEQAAAPEKKDSKANEAEDPEAGSDNENPEPPDDEAEALGSEDMDVTEPNLKEEQVLDLPDDMELDEQEKRASDIDDTLDEDFPDDDMEMGENEPENVVPSEARAEGLESEQNDEKGQSGEAVTDQDSKEQTETSQKQESSAQGGEEGEVSGNQAGGNAEDAVEDPQAQAFKKLGDILEQWHRSQRKIKEASQDENLEIQHRDVNMEEVDFEHLANDEDAADTQALGQASEEQVRNVDQNQAIESNEQPDNDDVLPDAADIGEDGRAQALKDVMQLDYTSTQADQKETMPLSTINNKEEHTLSEPNGQVEAQENIDDVDRQLSEIHLSSDLPPLTPPDEARRLWSHYEAITHDLSLSLTEQLRLILAPTMATKLRGDYRTGKRLNIKRIIPYIASQYKRDKIWMRRSVPSKRNYQIMLAVDDSKSMLESASGQLAFETLALVSRSLSMLEAGDLCIVSFGNEDHIRVAHEFGKAFSSEAGCQVFQQFSFRQTGTNVKRLVQESIALFREARAKRSSSSGDLWQLQLIISDGICEDHDDIRRLLRQAQEERIMIVFIIVDAVKEESGSIMNLTQATFEADESGIAGGIAFCFITGRGLKKWILPLL